jgi:predicted dienelactone hydrolase
MRGIVAMLSITYMASTLAATPHYDVGVTHLAVQDGTAAAFDTVIYHPIAERRFPVVLISHGRDGGPFSHRELATALAQAGFIVILPTHVGDAGGLPRAASQAQILIDRPRQAEAALDAVLTDPRFIASVDVDQISMIGYSAGGYTALILAGAQPDFAHARAFCAGRHDPGTCPPAHTQGAVSNPTAASSTSGIPSTLLAWHPPVDRRIKRLVLLDPLAVMFTPAGLSNVRVPTLLIRPEDDSYLSSGPNSLAVLSGLPQRPALEVVPGNHFVLIDPCPESVDATVYHDAPGIDRVAIHRHLEREIVSFLQERE